MLNFSRGLVSLWPSTTYVVRSGEGKLEQVPLCVYVGLKWPSVTELYVASCTAQSASGA